MRFSFKYCFHDNKDVTNIISIMNVHLEVKTAQVTLNTIVNIFGINWVTYLTILSTTTLGPNYILILFSKRLWPLSPYYLLNLFSIQTFVDEKIINKK